jgi:UPF0755 protein
MNNKHDEEFDERRRHKVENFQVNIHDDAAGDSQPEEGKETVISSYSDPKEAQKKEINSEEAALNRAKLAHTLRNKEKARKNRRLFRGVWFCIFLLFSVLAAKYVVADVNDMLAVGRQSVNVTVEIPKNATSGEVSQILYSVGAIRNVDAFRLYSKLTKAPATYGGGSYKITTGLDYEALINSIQSSAKRVDTVKITFTEGMNAPEIAASLEKNGVCSSADALKAFNTNKLDDNYDLIAAIPNVSSRYYKLEGYLFPDTYEFFKNEDTVDVVEKLVSNCNKKLTKQIRDKAKEEKMTVDQMITLASMIQSEAANKTDMYNVSSVFHNRLNSKDAALNHLNSDPTTLYPYRKRAQVPANIRSTYKSKYDTYTITGLPAGAVCNPGLDAINAALNPNSTNYYYFCHDAKGNAYYAKTLSGHEANLKKAGLK